MKLTKEQKDRIENICFDHRVEKLYVFGSFNSDRFNEDSDVDLLVKFKQFELEEYFDNYMSLRDSLHDLLRREIDLVEEQTLKNPILISEIAKSKELLYGQS